MRRSGRRKIRPGLDRGRKYNGGRLFGRHDQTNSLACRITRRYAASAWLGQRMFGQVMMWVLACRRYLCSCLRPLCPWAVLGRGGPVFQAFRRTVVPLPDGRRRYPVGLSLLDHPLTPIPNLRYPVHAESPFRGLCFLQIHCTARLSVFSFYALPMYCTATSYIVSTRVMPRCPAK